MLVCLETERGMGQGLCSFEIYGVDTVGSVIWPLNCAVDEFGFGNATLFRSGDLDMTRVLQ